MKFALKKLAPFREYVRHVTMTDEEVEELPKGWYDDGGDAFYLREGRRVHEYEPARPYLIGPETKFITTHEIRFKEAGTL